MLKILERFNDDLIMSSIGSLKGNKKVHFPKKAWKWITKLKIKQECLRRIN